MKNKKRLKRKNRVKKNKKKLIKTKGSKNLEKTLFKNFWKYKITIKINKFKNKIIKRVEKQSSRKKGE